MNRDEYDAWLDELDRKLYLEKGVIYAAFQKPLQFAFAEYKDVAGLKQCAIRLRSALHESEPDLPRDYLVRQFLSVAIKRARIHTSTDFIINMIRTELNIKEPRDF